MAEDEEGSKRLVLLHDLADADLTAIFLFTYQMWGERQAAKYLCHLHDVIDSLARHPEIGSPIEGRPGVYSFLTKTRASQMAHGHRVVYRPTSDRLLILRLLHTSLIWDDLGANLPIEDSDIGDPSGD